MASPPSPTDESPEKSPRPKYSRSQLNRLEQEFEKHHFLNTQQALELSAELGISFKQIRTWFQNKRATMRRLEIRAAGRSYVPPLQRPVALCRPLARPPASPRGAGDGQQSSGSPAALAPAALAPAADCPSVQVQHLVGAEAQPQQSVSPLGPLHAGADYLTVPQPQWNDRLSPTMPPSPPSVVGSSGDEGTPPKSLEVRPNVATSPVRPYGSLESMRPANPRPPLTTAFSQSDPCVSFGSSPDEQNGIQYGQMPYNIAPDEHAASMQQGQPQWQPQWQPLDAPQLPPPPPVANNVHQEGWSLPAPMEAAGDQRWGPWVPSPWQPAGASASTDSAREAESLRDIDEMTSLALELNDAAISRMYGGAGPS